MRNLATISLFAFSFVRTATGEPALCMSIVVIFALRHALDAAREESGLKSDDDFVHLGAPTTPEAIFQAANNQTDQYLLTS